MKDLPFTPVEYDRRLKRARAAMEERGLDAVFITDPSNQNWLTGYDGWSFYVHQGAILTMDGPPLWWGRHMDMLGGRRTCWMENDFILGYGDHFVQSTERHPMQDLAEVLKRYGLETATIGVEMENYYYSAKAHAVLCAEMPNAKIVDATTLVNWQRIVKSDEELVLIRKAARISEKVMRTAIDMAEPGLRKNDLVASILKAGIEGVDDDWGDYPAIMPLTPSGLDATAAHLTWNGNPMQPGEATFFELSGCYRRYHAPLCRTVFLGGEPPQDIRDAEKAQLEGIEAGLDAARPGNRTRDIAQALLDVLAKYEIKREGRMGYPVGVSYPPDWGERTASIRLEDETVLEPGMVFHFMPALWMDTWGLETTETILINEDGPAECLCNMPRQMFVKD
ncbi:M24 family metallopeptidase [Roseovarius atlanticus]|uniref:M24 family metallopeptidase n=1 Tax=Roseovarius atlanticus TaxID=1641875 RepID=UPI001C93B009|nr:M24 family metallopeptidase [Roseovarius atlanticus]MBY5987246.1 M24 family metallopeptidase [Roseovarius atlanticus]MBY6125886.1 M24 family metallopeptidase [Roseovarius atlanticus]MBY6149653.1 M24 family metallopeptidase [Roseovarius atlanticus]